VYGIDTKGMGNYSLSRAPKAVGVKELAFDNLFSTEKGPWSVYVEGDTAWYLIGFANSLFKVTAATSIKPTKLGDLGAVGGGLFSLDATSFVIMSGGGLMKVSKADGTTQVIAADVTPTALAVDGGKVFFTGTVASKTGIFSADPPGPGAVVTPLGDVTNAFGYLNAGGGKLTFTSLNAASTPGLRKWDIRSMSQAGGPVTTLATAVELEIEYRGCGAGVYWVATDPVSGLQSLVGLY